MAQSPSFFDLLTARAQSVSSCLCVGIDPHTADLEKLGDVSGAGALAFGKRIVDATKHLAAAYKPNAAFFEALGPEGTDALRQLIDYIPDDIPVLLDNKRGDIGSTAAAYALAAYSALNAHAVTVNPYMGSDSISPFVSDPSKAAFVLCKTSNPSSTELQELSVADSSDALFERVAKLASTTWNSNNNVGLVVGATDVAALRRVRAAAPDLWILAPGIGAQGGNLEEAVTAGLRSDGSGLLVPVSRGISRADDPRAAAEDLRSQLNAARDAVASAAQESKTAGNSSLEPYQEEFIRASLDAGVLKFGEFTLKSGRVSPYFFNAGLFNTGALLHQIGESYASALEHADVGLEYDMVFGPAYKGITLVSALSIALSRRGRSVPFAYNRKEKKDHGEGGLLVGAPVQGKRVLIVDDVITAGTAIREAIGILRQAGAQIAGVVIALDRAEKVRDDSSMSAIQSVQQEFGVPVVNIIALRELLGFVQGQAQMASTLERIIAYRDTYGVQ